MKNLRVISCTCTCRCGVSFCIKKCLSLLPSVGDDEDEDGDGDFEVQMHVHKCNVQYLHVRCMQCFIQGGGGWEPGISPPRIFKLIKSIVNAMKYK